MLTDERDVVPRTDGLPAWAALADPVATTTRPVARGVAVRVVGAGSVAVALFLLGHRLGAAILLAVLALSSVLSLTVPAVGTAIDAFLASFQRFVGRGLTFVLLGAVFVVVFVPVSLVLRVLRHDPLELGASVDDPTYWRDRAPRRGRPLYRRPFTYERHPAPVARGRRTGRLRSAVALLVVLALLDLGTGTLIGADEKEGAGTGGEFSLPVPDVGARQNEPWAQELFDELALHYDRAEYHPYRGWTVRDVAGEHLNVTDEVRRSYEAEAGATDPVVVYFFGGSAMMGWFQRDEHTIPSEFVKLAEADGIHVQALNYGQPAYTNWQELLLLEELLSRGDVPDLAVFYDGVNEITPQFRGDETRDPSHVQARETEARLRQAATSSDDEESGVRRMLDAYASQSAVAELVRRARGTNGDETPGFFSPWPDQLEHPDRRGEAAAAVHRRGVDIVEHLAASYGFSPAFVWQPWIYSKSVTPGEEPAVGSWGTDPAAWTTAGDAARNGMHDSVIDLSDALDSADDPVMYDFVHTNERGAEIVAKALYEHLKPTLVALQSEAPA
jgi:hypothetical protein